MAVVFFDKRATKNPWVLYFRVYGEPGEKPKQKWYHFPTKADALEVLKQIDADERAARVLRIKKAVRSFVHYGPHNFEKTENSTLQNSDPQVTAPTKSPNPQTTPKLELAEALRKYPTMRVKSVKTATRERGYFAQFYKYCYEREIFYLEDVKYEHLKAYQEHLYFEQKNFASSVNQKFGSIRSFFNEMKKHRYLVDSPTEHLESFKAPLEDRQKRLPQAQGKGRKIWTIDDFNMFYNATSGDWMKRVLIALWETGRAPCELQRMKVGDVDLENGVINNIERFKGKGSEVAPLRISPKFNLFLRQEIARLKSIGRGDNECPLFPGDSPKDDKSFSVDNLTQRLLKLNKKLGVKGFTAYDLRHSLATYLAEQKVPMHDIKTFMGHKKISTTERYIHVNEIDLTDSLKERSSQVWNNSNKRSASND